MNTDIKPLIDEIMTQQGFARLSDFSRGLNQKLELKVARSTVHYWYNGGKVPYRRTLEYIRASYQPEDWQYQFASTLLSRETDK
jgi:hypothetical protein